MARFNDDEEQAYLELKHLVNDPDFLIKHLMQMAASEDVYSNFQYNMAVEVRVFLRVIADFVDAKK